MNNHPGGVLLFLGNSTSVGAIFAALAGWLPPLATFVASIVAIIWYALLIYESDTLKAYRQDRRYRQLHKLEAKKEAVTRAIAQRKAYETKEFADDPAEAPNSPK